MEDEKQRLECFCVVVILSNIMFIVKRVDYFSATSIHVARFNYCTFSSNRYSCGNPFSINSFAVNGQKWDVMRCDGEWARKSVFFNSVVCRIEFICISECSCALRESHDKAKIRNYFVAIVVVFRWFLMDFRTVTLCALPSQKCSMRNGAQFVRALASCSAKIFYLTKLFLFSSNLFTRALLIFIVFRSKQYFGKPLRPRAMATSDQ